MLRAAEGNFLFRHETLLSQGLAALRSRAVDVILLDLGLPDSSGLETLTRTRSQASEIPIIVITALPEVDVAVRALNQGAQDFISKELIDAPRLAKAIRRLTNMG